MVGAEVDGLTLLSCEADVRVGGGYRLVFGVDASKTMAFFGKYIEVTPHSRIVWTNDESGEDGAVTTVTLEEKGGKTLLVLHELYPSKEALDAALASGGTTGWARRSSNWTRCSSRWARAWVDAKRYPRRARYSSPVMGTIDLAHPTSAEHAQD